MVRLLITSPEGYAQRLVRAFEERGNRSAFHLCCRPMIHTDVAIDTEEFHSFVTHLDDYDYVAFSSRKAMDALDLGLRRWKRELPPNLGLCAIGKDNEYLKEKLKSIPAFVSEEPSPMGIVQHLSGILEIRDKRIAVLAPQVVGMAEPSVVPDFVAGLKNIGMEVTRVNVYQTQAASEGQLQETARLIENHEVDAVVFTSGTEIKVFLKMVPPGFSVEDFLGQVTVICYGPYTAGCARNYGVKTDFVSPSFGSFQELAEQVDRYYQSKKISE